MRSISRKTCSHRGGCLVCQLILNDLHHLQWSLQNLARIEKLNHWLDLILNNSYMWAMVTAGCIALGGTTALDTLASTSFTASRDVQHVGVLLQRAMIILWVHRAIEKRCQQYHTVWRSVWDWHGCSRLSWHHWKKKKNESLPSWVLNGDGECQCDHIRTLWCLLVVHGTHSFGSRTRSWTF